MLFRSNYNTVPYDTRKPFDPSGIRLGTPGVTTRGLTEEHMPQVAAWMSEAVDAAKREDEDTLARIKGEVAEFVRPYQIPGWPTS